MVVSTELGSCTCVCTHKTVKRQVGAQQDVAVTCASCEVLESAMEHMKKSLFECTVLIVYPLGCSGFKEELPSRQLPPTRRGGELSPCMCTASEAQCMQRDSVNELRSMRGRIGASQRRVARRIVNAEGSGETLQPFKPHLNTVLLRVQRSRVPKIQTTNGRARGIPSSLRSATYRKRTPNKNTIPENTERTPL